MIQNMHTYVIINWKSFIKKDLPYQYMLHSDI